MSHHIENKNYNNKPFEVSDGSTIIDCNLSQKKAHTTLFAGKKNLKFKRCNLHNVEIDPSWKVEKCLSFHADVVEEPEIDEKLERVKEAIGTIQEVADLDPNKAKQGILSQSTKKAIIEVLGITAEDLQ